MYVVISERACVLFIEPTVFVVKPDDVTPSFPDPVTLRVKATSDPDTEVSYTWYHYDEQSECEEKWCVVYQVANKTHISHDDGSSLTILNTGVDDLGLYRCVASNGIDTAVHEVKLITPPDDTTTSMLVITFCVSRRRRKMYCGHPRLCVCLCVCPRPHAHTTARTRM